MGSLYAATNEMVQNNLLLFLMFFSKRCFVYVWVFKLSVSNASAKIDARYDDNVQGIPFTHFHSLTFPRKNPTIDQLYERFLNYFICLLNMYMVDTISISFQHALYYFIGEPYQNKTSLFSRFLFFSTFFFFPSTSPFQHVFSSCS